MKETEKNRKKLLKKRAILVGAPVVLAVFAFVSLPSRLRDFSSPRWREVKELIRSDLVSRLEGWGRVVKVSYLAEGVDVFNLSVGDPHTFLADGVFAHNKGGGGCSTSLIAWSPRDGSAGSPGNNSPLCHIQGESVPLLARYLSTDCPFPHDLSWAIYDWSGCNKREPFDWCPNPPLVYSATTSLPSDPSPYYVRHQALPCEVTNPVTGECIRWSSSFYLPPGDYRWRIIAPGGDADADFTVDCGCQQAVAIDSLSDFSCLPGDAQKTWSLSFASHSSSCEPFSLEVAVHDNSSGEDIFTDAVTGITGDTADYTYTVPDTASTGGRYTISFRTVSGDFASDWVSDDFDTDNSPPVCAFSVHADPGNCSGGDISGTTTTADSIDLRYTGSGNTGCASLAKDKAWLTGESVPTSWSSYPASCFVKDLDISGYLGNFSVSARFRDSLDQESVTCSQSLSRSVGGNFTISGEVWDDSSSSTPNGDRDAGEGLLANSRVVSIAYRPVSGGSWMEISTTNSYSVTLPAGDYRVGVKFASSCPNYAEGTATSLGAYQGTLNGYHYRTVSLTSDTTLDFGGWEPWEAKTVAGNLWVDDDCQAPYSVGDTGTGHFLAETVSLSGSGAKHGDTDTASTGNGRYTLGDDTATFKVAYCDTASSPETVSVTIPAGLPPYLNLLSPASLPVTADLAYGASEPVSAEDIILCDASSSWAQVEGDAFAQTVSLVVPSGDYFASGLPFASGSVFQCDPGQPSATYDAFVSYGDYRADSDPANWSFAWQFGDDTSSFTSVSSYNSFESGHWYLEDDPGRLENADSYRVSRSGVNDRGVAYLVVDGDVTISRNLAPLPGGEDASGLVVFVNGDLTFASSLVGEVDALFVVNGTVAFEGADDLSYPDDLLTIRGGVYAMGGVDFIRAYAGSQQRDYPIAVFETKPAYWLYEGDSLLSASPLYWEEL